MSNQQKTLIIRLSSFGDILQCLGVPNALKTTNPQNEIHWVVRSDFEELLKFHPQIAKVWAFDRKLGLFGWLKLCKQLRKEGFTHIYDAHNNLRSQLLVLVFLLLGSFPYFCRRPKFRWKRFLLFKLRKNHFPKPFKGQVSFLDPLKKWGISQNISEEPQLHFAPEVKRKAEEFVGGFRPFTAVAPSAAWEMKRWPLAYWKELIKLSPGNFVVLGGPNDGFCEELKQVAPERVLNMAGKFSLLESCAAVDLAEVVISADTGLMHAADLLGKKTIALIGPTAFGYPSHDNSIVAESHLQCQPCSKDGRGKCSQPIYQKCMIEVKPERVATLLKRFQPKKHQAHLEAGLE